MLLLPVLILFIHSFKFRKSFMLTLTTPNIPPRTRERTRHPHACLQPPPFFLKMRFLCFLLVLYRFRGKRGFFEFGPSAAFEVSLSESAV